MNGILRNGVEDMVAKGKWMIGFIILITLMSGCTNTNKSDGSKASKQEDNIKQLTFDDYTEEAVRLRSEFTIAIQAFGEVRQSANNNEKEWTKQSIEKINAIREVLNEFGTIAPPDENKEMGEAISIALNEYHKGMDLFEEATYKRDEEIDKKALEHLQKGQDYWNYSFRLLSIDNPISVEGSDGTIDSQDLKDLDLNAGIDRDSVLLNVSKEGKELVGHWGFINDDGTHNVSIVLHEDGSYEGYGNGEFPNKDNAYEGTWEWNYIRGTLTFHHDVLYKNGEKLNEGEFRKQMPMELQRYDESGIQLFDLESMATFAYQKFDDKVVEE